ncbi:MAG TPA: HlyD family secretion protein [Acetobacteraceae bacterium]|nr:HlyD family secretion protein [Acetobacteraceae bacterium]
MDDLTKHARIASQQSTTRVARPKSAARLAVLLVVLIGAGIAGYDWWLGRDQVSTDDAFVDGRAVSVAPQVAGQVVGLMVDDNQLVKQGEPLLQIDPRSFQAAREEAAADLRTAQAELESARARRAEVALEAPARLEAARAQVALSEAILTRAQADWRRQIQMPRGATTQQEVDAANAARLSAEANLAAARAAVSEADTVAEQLAQADATVQDLTAKVALARARLQEADLNLAWTRVTAPADGQVTKRDVEVGDYVQPGQALMSLVLPARWITANFKESDLRLIRPGQAVDISVDAYPDLRLKGHVDSVQLGTGSRFTAFPPENATGNFVKIVQRVPVKVAIDTPLDLGHPLPLGASAVPVIHVR